MVRMATMSKRVLNEVNVIDYDVSDELFQSFYNNSGSVLAHTIQLTQVCSEQNNSIGLNRPMPCIMKLSQPTSIVFCNSL